MLTETGEEVRLRQPDDPIAAIDRAIARVDEKRSYLGAMENRLGNVIEGANVTSINLTEARSRIMDADYAAESSALVKAQILQQAGNGVLAQTNLMPETVLALLG
ncbi:flagellin [Halomonas sp. Bachu 37]|uniref:flagellin n=1 Tax=Halomonas kashgarensis TaxID=3084920 RepID=UPI00321650FD